MYVSQLVYGDQKAAFLLPWRRHFNLNDAQVGGGHGPGGCAVARNILALRGRAVSSVSLHMHEERVVIPAERWAATQFRVKNWLAQLYMDPLPCWASVSGSLV